MRKFIPQVLKDEIYAFKKLPHIATQKKRLFNLQQANIKLFLESDDEDIISRAARAMSIINEKKIKLKHFEAALKAKLN